MELALVILYSYLIGSIPFGVIITKLFTGKNIRKKGSKNIGATNALRTGGFFVGFMTFLFDFAKGYFPVIITINLFGFDHLYYLFSAIACFVGHIYPVWLKFKGGKGVATFLGVLLALSMKMFFVVFLLMLAVVAKTRYVSLASLIGVLAAGTIAFFEGDPNQALVILGMAIIVVLRHKDNIERLLKNRENKIKLK